MSRIGKKPIALPAKVEVKVSNQDVTVKGPKGEMKFTMPENMSLKQESNQVVIERAGDDRDQRALHGLTRALVSNMITGVSTGFRKTLVIEGVGYSSDMRGKDLVLKLGYSHEIVVNPPPNVAFNLEERGRIIHIDGIDKQVVGQVAANIRKLRPPEPYLGKGVRYNDEVIRRKAGKAGKTK